MVSQFRTSEEEGLVNFGGGKWVKATKDHTCDGCLGPIAKGESHYNYRGMYDGEWQNWRMHEECFEAWEANGCGEFTMGSFDPPERSNDCQK